MLKSTQKNWIDPLIILFLTLLPSLFFWRLIAPKPDDQWRIAAGDFTEQYFPLRAFSAGEWVAGRIPLWNPSLFGGQPALADIQSGALYPPHIIEALALGWAGIGFPVWALEWQVIFHFSIAAVGAYLLGRYWGLRTGADLKSARFMGVIISLTFTYGGYLTGFPVQQVTILQVSVWLPWVMWLLSRTLDAVADGKPLKQTAGAAAWVGVALALAILAGHPQTVMYIFYLASAYVLFRMALEWQQHGVKVVSILAHWMVSAGLGVALSAAQLWPTLQFISRSLRTDLAFEAVSAGLPLSELVTLLYPGYFGGSPAYIGILPLLLIAVAVTLSRPSLRLTVLFWSAVGLLAMLLAFGANTFLYPVIYLAAPGFDAVRQQERAFLLFSFAAAVLSGYGALTLCRAIDAETRPAWQGLQRNFHRTAGVALALTGLFLYGSVSSTVRGDEVNLFYGVLRHHIFGLIILGGSLLLFALRPRRVWRRWWGMALVAGWLIFNLFTVNWRFNPEDRPASDPFTPAGVSQFLIEHTAATGESIRVASGGLLAGGNSAASVYGLEDITGNTPLQLADVAAFAEQIPSWRLWQLMNVRYVVDRRDIDGPGLARRYEADGVKVYEVGDPFPRAGMVYDVISGNDWSVLAADETDLRQTALIPAGISLSFTMPTEPPVVSVAESRPGLVVVDIQTGEDGLLVLSNIDYPGWQATLNGRPVEILKTNGVFQGVRISAGENQVRLAFEPVLFKWGVRISVVGIIFTVGMIVFSRRK